MSVFRISETIKAAAAAFAAADDLRGVCLRLFTPTCQLVGRSQSSAANEEEVALLPRHPRYEFSAYAFKQYQSSLLLQCL